MNIWRLTLQLVLFLFSQEHANSFKGRSRFLLFPQWRKTFGIYRNSNIHVRSFVFSQDSRSLKFKAGFVCLFVQAIYFDYNVYSSMEKCFVDNETILKDQNGVNSSLWAVDVGNTQRKRSWKPQYGVLVCKTPTLCLSKRSNKSAW